MKTRWVSLPSATRAEACLSALLTSAILFAVALPEKRGQNQEAEGRKLFALAESDYFSPVLSSSGTIRILNGALGEIARFAGYDEFHTRLSLADRSHLVNATRYSGDVFALLGVQFLARTSPADGTLGIYISEQLWEEAFDRDPAILGRRVELSHQTYTIAGITRPFSGMLANTEVWEPVPSRSPAALIRSMRIIGTLQPGIGFTDAQRAITSTFRNFLSDHPDSVAATTRLVPIDAGISFDQAYIAGTASSRERGKPAVYQAASLPIKRGS